MFYLTNFYFVMYITLPTTAGVATPHALTHGGNGQVFSMDYPLTGYWAMFEMVMLGFKFGPNWDGELRDA